MIKKNMTFRYGTTIFMVLFSNITIAGVRTVKVKNNVTKKMTQYKKFGTHTPSTFTITVNEQLIEKQEEKEISVKNNKLDVRYDYAFGSHKKGAKVVAYKIPETTKNLAITFNWKDEWRVLIDGATPISVEEVSV